MNVLYVHINVYNFLQISQYIYRVNIYADINLLKISVNVTFCILSYLFEVIIM